MGTGIHMQAQKRVGNEWVNVDGDFTDGKQPFSWRSYGMFAFLADVRNYSAVPPISAPRGLPDDYPPENSDVDDFGGSHSHSWLTVEELLAFNYEQPVEDRRRMVQTGANSWDGGGTAEPGRGQMTTYRDFLGAAFFSDLDELRRIGADRIVFEFDS